MKNSILSYLRSNFTALKDIASIGTLYDGKVALGIIYYQTLQYWNFLISIGTLYNENKL